MYGQDLRTREYLASMAREADEGRRQRKLVADARHAQAGRMATATPSTTSMIRRTRFRIGEAIVAAGQAVAGPADDGCCDGTVGHPA